ncbi:hypothetical protein F1645_13665 [Novacetimonas hansenii]|uniref:Uncharacterized protein n=2 Tax=Novacetimonas hansenii TaxID=436 RepID=A0ABQ0SJ95_NOVHA|nr:hypothetical protein [Novacetimonas hansenii]EFG85378.1 hypothetical protein GXY_03073 [Novacetimonas hansenii ATCC 23769]GAN84919.1 hypothetical protein Gaha_0251_002 [Novacetimonas hansenii JCM 7643]GBQ60054.1 hypothetical protein AA0243_2218 [Novacetimonas hansenii NRIC 0243]GEC65321.1 hypothetical protein GHA01_31700 [Novacetimonas hansenii]
MTIRRKDALLSEIGKVKEILQGIPMENVIDRFGLEARLKELNLELERLPDQFQEAEKLSLTFRGEPVRGSSAISADFAGNASSAFADAFSAVMAGLKGALKYVGPIPDKETSPLMITGMATGSYGFEMELPPSQGELFSDDANVGKAVEIVKDLLRVSAKGSDDDILDIVEEIHPRAVRKVADFLSIVSKKGAWCGLEFRDSYFKFSSLDEIIFSEQRLRQENISENQEVYFGEFQGFLPHGRNFEFVVSDGSGIIRGRLGPDIEDPEILNREWLHRPTSVKFNVIQVGQSRPRYTLVSLDDLG